MKKVILIVVLLFTIIFGKAQNADSIHIRKIFSEALTDYTSYEQLKYLCKQIGGRIAGSKQSLEAVYWAKAEMEKLGADTVYLQECKVRSWNRGAPELSYVKSKSSEKLKFQVCALGGSVGTPIAGITAGIVEVKSIDELQKLGADKIKGKVVFFNRPANPEYYNTFMAYGRAADQRVIGASMAASYGAVASVTRSLTVIKHKYPHTGILRYIDSLPKIPAFAISTTDADVLSGLIIKDSSIQIFLKSSCSESEEVISYNVIAELKGCENPEEYIVVGGHLDAWDNGEGAHDDGAGIVQTMEVLRIYKKIGFRPKHTLRFIAFMDEEMAQRGARKYAESVALKNEKHIAALESDVGAFLPLGFSYVGGDEVAKRFEQWKPILDDYGLNYFLKGYSGVDISFLRDRNFPLFGLMCDSQRYFNYQHAATDVFESVFHRELQLGSASMTALIYLIDNYGF